MSAPDRLQELLQQSQVTGIDFVYVNENQVTLDVYFLRSPDTLETPLVDDVNINQINIYNPTGGTTLSPIPLNDLVWIEVDGRNVLRLTTSVRGDFTQYRLHIDDHRIDPYFNDVNFSFKAHCKSDLDCQPPGHECPPEDEVDFAVDYRARDFFSFRRALLDYAAQQYPDWMDRLEADAGIMLIEVMSALGDELAYYQDRIAREAHLETASQRRSLRRHARLVDYHIHDGLGASTWLDVTAKRDGLLPAGMEVWAIADNGLRVDYEIGWGLENNNVSLPETFAVDSKRNSFQPHLWDEDDTCLAVRATELFIKGHHTEDLPLDDFITGRVAGRWVLLKTNPRDSEIAERTWMVRLITVEDTEDPVFVGEKITRLVWEEAQALPFELDLTTLEIRGNLVPATAGKQIEAFFVIGVEPDALNLPENAVQNMVRAVEREGRTHARSLNQTNFPVAEENCENGATVTYLFSLPESESKPLVWLGVDPRRAVPEIRLEEVELNGDKWEPFDKWNWRRLFIGIHSSLPTDRHFTLEDGVWKRVVGFQRSGQEIVHEDYASGNGFTIRFGDGEIGRIPDEGTVFRVTYRLGSGRRGNLAAGSLTNFDSEKILIENITNPLPSNDGLDPESSADIKQLAPEAFRAVTFRAVRPEDYAEAAERLEGVQRAGASFRWTGSWLSAFVTPDPRGAVTVNPELRSELLDQLDRFRQAGREVHFLDPRYADIDLEITVCVAPDSYRGDVKEGILEALLGKSGLQTRAGFLSPDNFTFGFPLERSALEAAIQAVPGVRAVENMRVRRRGTFDWRDFVELMFEVGKDEIIRLENDPLHPERGSLRLIMEGGA